MDLALQYLVSSYSRATISLERSNNDVTIQYSGENGQSFCSFFVPILLHLKYWRQMACKPGSVLASRRGMTIPLGRSLPNASRDLPGRRRGNALRAVPIWSCSRWGLPCRSRCRDRGALLPHHFNLAAALAGRRYDFCGAIPGVASAGHYPAPCFRGARTFLQPVLRRTSGHPAI
jgi:hypothetical protein